MRHIWSDKTPRRPTENQRTAERRAIALPARLMWKDQRGAARFANVVTRDVSDFGVYVECTSALPISLYRLVQFQLDCHGHETQLPDSLKSGRILSAVYRVSPPSPSGARRGLALRLMVDPKRYATELIRERATA